MTARPLIEDYLTELAGVLPSDDASAGLIAEARDHLLEAASAYERVGAVPAAAQQRAIEEFGSLGQLAEPFTTAVIVRDARRQAVRQLALFTLLAASGISAVDLVPEVLGQSQLLSGQPPFVAKLVATTILVPSAALWLLSRTGHVWSGRAATRLLRWVQRVDAVLFILAIPTAAALVGLDWSHLLHGPSPWVWMAGGAALAHLATHWVYASRFRRPAIFR